MSEYKMPPMAHFGSKENYKRFMDGEDAKEAVIEEELEQEYGDDLPKTEIPYKEKEKGKIEFQNQQFLKATKHYSKALLGFNFLVKDNMIKSQEQMIKMIQDIQVPCNINLALCYQKMGEYTQALHFAEKAVEIDQYNPKALYRKAMQNIYLQNFKEAHRDLIEAYKIDPKNNEIIKAFEFMAQQKEKFQQKMKKMSQKVIQQMEYSEDNEQNQQENIKEEKQSLYKQFKQLWGSIYYHTKVSLLIPADIIMSKCCKRRIPVSYYKKTN